MNLSGKEVKHIVETLAYGHMDDVYELMYGNDVLAKEQLNLPLQIIGALHDPTGESAISIAEARYQDPFWMLILQVPWLNQERTGPYYPVLLAHQDVRHKVAGIVMPWNEISSKFTEAHRDAATRLTTWWAMWLKKHQPSK